MSKTIDYGGYRDWKNWSQSDFGKTTHEESLYFDSELRKVGIASLQDVHIVEVGFGNGSFAAWARERGARYSGIEAIDDLVTCAKLHGYTAEGSGVALDSWLVSDSVDLVVAFDVFEHIDLPDLIELLRKLKSVLKPNALLMARIPSGDSPFSSAIQNGDLTHCKPIGSSAVRQIALKAGLELVTIREPSLPVIGLTWRQLFRRVALLALRRPIYLIISNVLMGGGGPILSPNMLFVLKKPRTDDRIC